MKKILRYVLILSILFIPSANAGSFLCESSGVLKALRVIFFVINIIKVLVPIVIIVTGIMSLIKAVLDSNDIVKDKVYILIEKFIIGGLIFFLPSCLYNVITGFSFTTSINKFTVCNECLLNNDKCDGLIDTALKKEEKERKENDLARQKLKESYEKQLAEEKAKREKEKNDSGDTDEPLDKSSSRYFGQKYSLSETELKQIAYQCYREQGSAVGAAAEASLMANKYEMYTGSSYSSLHSYIKNCGWWAHSKSNMSGNPDVPSSVVESVRQVLVYGNRTLPYYIDEHDCIKCGDFYDIISATNNGVEIDRDNRSLYKSGVTVLKNRYGSTYTFYCFPTSSSDPFGYTAGAYNRYNKMKG